MLKYILKKDRRFLVQLTIVPAVVIIIMSYLFSNIYIENINYGIVNLDDSSLSRAIVQGLANHPGLNVCYYTDSPEKLKDAIYSKKVTAGIIIPKDYGKDINEKRSTKAIVIVDATNLMLGNNASGYSSAVMSTFNARYQLGILEGKNMMPQSAARSMGTFSLVDRTLYDPMLSCLTFIVYVIVPLLLQIFYLNQYLLPNLIKEKEAFGQELITVRKVRGILGRLIPRLLLIWLVIDCSTLTGLLIANLLFGLPMRGNLLAHFVLITLFLMSLTIMGFVFITFLTSKNYHYYIEVFSIIYTLFMLTSGATWPVYMMPPGLMFVVRLLWPFSYIVSPFKLLHLKGIGWQLLMPYMAHLIVFCMVWLCIAGLLNCLLIARKNKNLRKADLESAK